MPIRETPSLPTSLIPSEVAPPPIAQRRLSTPPPSPPSPPTDTLILDGVAESAVSTTDYQTTVDLIDGDGEVVVDDAPEDSSPPTAELLNNTMSLKQLKDRCVELGLSTAGKKMDLAERIVSS